MEDIGRRIRTFRQENGITLAEMAARTGLSPTYISEIERGKVQPSAKALRKLAKALNIPLSHCLGSDSLQQVIAQKLKWARKMRGLTQKELAEKAGVSPGLIGQLEMGRVSASFKTLERISRALGVSVCYLILDREELDELVASLNPELRKILTDPRVQVILGSICRLNDEQLRLLLNFIDVLNNPRI